MAEDEKNEPLDDTQFVFFFLRVTFFVRPMFSKLFKFARAGNHAEIHRMKQTNPGLEVNAKDMGDGAGGYASRDTAMHYAAAGGHLETVDLLEKLEAKIEAKNKLGSTPLHVAAAFGHPRIIEFLLEKKADLEAQNEIGTSTFLCSDSHKLNVKSH